MQQSPSLPKVSQKASSPLSLCSFPADGSNRGGPRPRPSLPTRPQRLRRCWTQRPSTRAERGPGRFRPRLRSSQLRPWRGFEVSRTFPRGSSQRGRVYSSPTNSKQRRGRHIQPLVLDASWSAGGPWWGRGPRALASSHRGPCPIRAQAGRAAATTQREPTRPGPSRGWHVWDEGGSAQFRL